MRNKPIAYACLLLLFFGTPLWGQEEYPFIKRKANILHYDSTAAPMQHFFRKWNQAMASGNSNINIVHIGGSHVQAGTFPHRVRTRLLLSHPTMVGGRGLIFPYSAAAKCNNPADYKVHCLEKVSLTRNVHKNPDHTLGLCGIAVTAHDVPTRIQMLSNDSLIYYAVTRIVLLGYSPDRIIPRISYDNREVFPSYIDSASHRYIFNLRQEVDSFDILLPCESGQSFTLTGVALGSRRPGITYHSIGVNGAAVPDFLKCTHLTTDLRLVRPDMVIFGIGINDAHASDFDSVAFKNNYLRLCDSIRSVNPDCAFIFITNNDCYRRTGRRRYAVNRNGLLVRDVCYRLAAQTGGAVWDQFEIMGGLESMKKWQEAGLAQRDKVHFTRAGYLLLGDMLYEALDHELRRNATLPAASSHTATTVRFDSADKTKTKSADTNHDGKALPRGLKRKPSTPRRAAIQPPASDTPTSTPVNDRFPYISQ